MRNAARTDANQSAIIAALREAGAGVEFIGKPVDLLVSGAMRWMFMEVKSSEYESRRPSKTRKGQMAFAERHPNGGPIATVWTVEQALRAYAVLTSFATPPGNPALHEETSLAISPPTGVGT